MFSTPARWLVLVQAVWLATAADTQTNWPSFRGLHARGVAEGCSTPARWNVATGEGLRWKTPIPGLSHASPIVWGNCILLTTAVSVSGEPELKLGLFGDIASANDTGPQRWVVLCLDKQSGARLWERTAHEGTPAVKRHPKATHANSSPATDGRRVVAFFGSEGLFCYDFTGRLQWQKSLGRLEAAFYRVPAAQWGFGSSPVIHRDKVLVQCDVLGDSFVAAFALEDGRELWRTRREDVPTWCTPTVSEQGGRAQVILNGYRHAGGYDLETGRELWRLGGGGDIPVPTPVVAEGLVFLTSAHGAQSPIYAIRLNAVGDVTPAPDSTTNTFIAWSVARRGNYMQTPLVVGSYLYCCHDAGVLSCYEARTGDFYYRERLGAGGAGFTASPVAADDKLYVTSERGQVYVLKTGSVFLPLATNELSEPCLATPAISAGTLFFRTRAHLLALGEK